MSLVRPCRALIWLLLAGLIWAPVAGAGEMPGQGLEEGEVRVTVTDVPGASAKQGKVTGLINAPPGVVWQVIGDLNNYRQFMPRTLNSLSVAPDKLPLILQRRPDSAREVEQLLGPLPYDPAKSRVSGGKYILYLYSHLNFPWPCKNRWYIIKLLQDETRAAQNRYQSTWSLVTGNLRENRGEWLIEPFDSRRTKVTYRLITDPGGAIPAFLIDKGTQTSLPQIIAAVRKQAENFCGRK